MQFAELHDTGIGEAGIEIRKLVQPAEEIGGVRFRLEIRGEIAVHEHLQQRFRRAEQLGRFRQHRLGAGYICGYAVELTLKARICDTLNWPGFPQTAKEFANYTSFKTHNLDVLLSLSGREQIIKQSHLVDWSFVRQWNPEDRYRIAGGISAQDAQQFLASTTALLPVI